VITGQSDAGRYWNMKRKIKQEKRLIVLIVLQPKESCRALKWVGAGGSSSLILKPGSRNNINSQGRNKKKMLAYQRVEGSA